MSEITTNHNGHEIRYVENEDIWRCWQLNLEAKTLSALKNKINKLDADRRRISVPAIYLSTGHSSDSGKPADVILIDADGKGVWITSEETVSGGYGSKPRKEIRRSKTSPQSLIEPTPENRAAIAAWKAAHEEAYAALKRAEKMKEAIPRLTIERLVELGAQKNEAQQ